MVPERYEDDPSLGAWVSNQRQRYRKRQQEELSLDDHWVQSLEELAFAWLCKAKTSTLPFKSGKKASTRSRGKAKIVFGLPDKVSLAQCSAYKTRLC